MIIDVSEKKVRQLKRKRARPKTTVPTAALAAETNTWTGVGWRLSNDAQPVPAVPPAPIRLEEDIVTVPRQRHTSKSRNATTPDLRDSIEGQSSGEDGGTPTRTTRPWWNRIVAYLGKYQAPKKRLRVCESVSLGEKRFLAIVRVDSESFLLGGATGNVAMLAKLSQPDNFTSVLKQKSEAAGLLQ